jgi:hypothetical protein
MTMIDSNLRRGTPRARAPLTLWGLTPVDIHDRFWAARGIRVVRPGNDIGIGGLQRPEAFLLLDQQALVIFELRSAVDRLHWTKTKLLSIRLRGTPLVAADAQRREPQMDGDTFVVQPSRYTGPVRIGLTTVPQIASDWASGTLPWRRLRAGIAQERRGALSLPGFARAGAVPDEAQDLLGHLAKAWDRPDLHIERAERAAPGVWKDTRTRLVGNLQTDGAVVWLGAGRTSIPDGLPGREMILWDDVGANVDGTQPAGAERGADDFDALAAMLAE